MAAQTPKRVVLGALDVNVHTPSRRAVSSLAGSPLKAGRPQVSEQEAQKPAKFHAQEQDQSAGEAGLAGTKRSRDVVEDRGLSPKKFRGGSDPAEFIDRAGEEPHEGGMGESIYGGEAYDRGLWSVDSMFSHRTHDAAARSSSSPRPVFPSSPSSQGILNSMDMNETQDTLITVPDAQAATEPVAASPSPPPVTTTAAPVVPRPTSQAQLREKARALHLRLSLASYKVRTNQTEVPLSRLQVRSTSPKLPSRSFNRSMVFNSRFSRDIQSAAIPNIRIQHPSSKPQPSSDSDRVPPSSPPTFATREDVGVSSTVQDVSHEEQHFAAPMSPKEQDEAMLDPRLRSPTPATGYPERLTCSPAPEQALPEATGLNLDGQ